MAIGPSVLQRTHPKTTVVQAGMVSQGDLERLASETYDAPQARNLAHLLAVAAGDEVRVTHVDEHGVVNHFVAHPKDPLPDGRDRGGIVVAAEALACRYGMGALQGESCGCQN
jgi:hypothetical protein